MPYSQSNGADLYYEDAGDGTTIVFLHGVMASHRFFEPQLTALSSEYRTIGIDFRGHGRSEKTELGHTVAQYARDVRAFLDRHGLEDVVLVGWSMGALVSWDYVDQFGTEDVRGLVDVDMEATRFRWDDYEHGLTDLDGLKTTLGLAQRDRTSLVERLGEQLYKEPPAAETRTMQFDELSRTPAPIKSAILFDALTRDYRGVLPEIDVPLLACAGADEKRGTVASVRHVAETVPEGSFELFEDSGHCPPLEEPDRFNRVLSRFVDSL
ncbi:alpha/beta hydrolase [Natronococcus pandeyae]|uniref:Alpha/beta hydrolase n=1 Tax=Natronococcus pandeyae TaxID=2055836 RepID=A0A8J8Q6Y0_9EURY|nr:alpha/beta hydrolase [Natronococcus pandeyae]TYL38759.1 alpha/beta hydrolase [Natronococcus pandeyae]